MMKQCWRGKRLLMAAVAVVLSLNLFGCAALDTVNELTESLFGGEDNIEPPNELVDYEPELAIRILWKESVGVGWDEQVVKLVPAIEAGKIYVADKQGLVEARDQMTGDLLWEAETDLPLSGGPGVGDQSLVFGGSNAGVVALGADSGEIMWTTRVSSEVLSVPNVVQDIVIVRTTDGKIFSLNANNGDELWVYEKSVPALSIRGAGEPIVVGGNIIAGFANGKVVALQLKNGKQLWETTVAIPQGRSEVERLVDLVADPVETQGVVFFASFQGGISALIAENGNVLWRAKDISSHSGMALDWRYLYVTDVNSDIWQLDLRNGASLWKQKELHRRELTAPVVYQDFVVVADYDGYVHWLSDTDGRQLGRVRVTDGPISARPVVIDDVVYVYAENGTLAALKAQSSAP